jgi:bifunctional UDP-N-acetylglucosamine pyrophosphorylase/glucosamine-1-phosphate N-acetyltransferase
MASGDGASWIRDGMIRAIVLAAGEGKRMKSARPKVLHELCGRPMLWYVVRALRDGGIDEVVVVAAPEVEPYARQIGAATVVQPHPRGTGDAVKTALDALPASNGRVLVAYGDMPLLRSELLQALLVELDGDAGAALAVLTAKLPLPSNFGRIVRGREGVTRIVEARDATPEELAIDEMNAGTYAFDEAALRDAVSKLRDDNAQGEYYLTDAVESLARGGRHVRSVAAGDRLDVLGINDRVELAAARRAMNARLCEAHMRAGVTIVDPDTTYLEPELSIGRDTVIYPNTSLSRLCEIGEGCTLGPNARLSYAKLHDGVTVRESVVLDSEVGNGTTIGPYAHVRDGCVLGRRVRVGNFVELKKSHLADAAKASHLSYVGDAQIGENSNVGAGTITCNFDGKQKHATIVGRDVSIGSNSSLVAPLTIGDGALTGAGSVVTRDVGPGERVAGNPARPLPAKRNAKQHP